MLKNILMLTIFAVTGAFLSGCGGNSSPNDSLEWIEDPGGPNDPCMTGEALCQLDN